MHTSHFARRQFLPETIDLTDTTQLAPVFEQLSTKLDADKSDGQRTGRRQGSIPIRHHSMWRGDSQRGSHFWETVASLLKMAM